MELTYTQCGDYLIPNLVLADTQEYHIGKYGRMRRAYLKEYRPALYVISRIAGEGKDRRLEPGDYYLSDAERADLQTLDESGLPVVLLLNAAARWNSPACWTACSISTPFCSFPSSGSRAGRPWPMCCWAALCRRAS